MVLLIEGTGIDIPRLYQNDLNPVKALCFANFAFQFAGIQIPDRDEEIQQGVRFVGRRKPDDEEAGRHRQEWMDDLSYCTAFGPFEMQRPVSMARWKHPTMTMVREMHCGGLLTRQRLQVPKTTVMKQWLMCSRMNGKKTSLKLRLLRTGDRRRPIFMDLTRHCRRSRISFGTSRFVRSQCAMTSGLEIMPLKVFGSLATKHSIFQAFSVVPAIAQGLETRQLQFIVLVMTIRSTSLRQGRDQGIAIMQHR
jgi:hypothetical protein